MLQQDCVQTFSTAMVNDVKASKGLWCVCLFDTMFRCCHWIISPEPQGTVKKTLLCWYLKSVWFRLSPLKSWRTQKSNFIVISSGIIISDNSHWKADIPPVRASFIMFELNQLDCYKKRHPRCCYPQYSITYRTHPRTPTTSPLAPTFWKAYVWRSHCFLSLLR